MLAVKCGNYIFCVFSIAVNDLIHGHVNSNDTAHTS